MLSLISVGSAAETIATKEKPTEVTQDLLKFDYAIMWVDDTRYRADSGWFVSEDYMYSLAMGAQNLSLKANRFEAEKEAFLDAYKQEYQNATQYRDLLEDMYVQYDESVTYRKELQDVYEQEYAVLNKQINKYKKERNFYRNLLIGAAVIGGVVAICSN